MLKETNPEKVSLAAVLDIYTDRILALLGNTAGRTWEDVQRIWMPLIDMHWRPTQHLARPVYCFVGSHADLPPARDPATAAA